VALYPEPGSGFSGDSGEGGPVVEVGGLSRGVEIDEGSLGSDPQPPAVEIQDGCLGSDPQPPARVIANPRSEAAGLRSTRALPLKGESVLARWRGGSGLGEDLSTAVGFWTEKVGWGGLVGGP